MRAALATAGAAMPQAVLDEQDDRYPGSRPKTVITVLGPVRIPGPGITVPPASTGSRPATGALIPTMGERVAVGRLAP
jgi:hypothetical protein